MNQKLGGKQNMKNKKGHGAQSLFYVLQFQGKHFFPMFSNNKNKKNFAKKSSKMRQFSSVWAKKLTDLWADLMCISARAGPSARENFLGLAPENWGWLASPTAYPPGGGGGLRGGGAGQNRAGCQLPPRGGGVAAKP